MGKTPHWTWEYFHIKDGATRDPTTKRFEGAVCNFCDNEVKARTTTNMPTHLKACEKVQAAGALGTIINQIANNGSKNPLPREIDVSGVKSEESAIGSKRIKREEPPRFTTLSSQFVMSTKAAEQVHFLLADSSFDSLQHSI